MALDCAAVREAAQRPFRVGRHSDRLITWLRAFTTSVSFSFEELGTQECQIFRVFCFRGLHAGQRFGAIHADMGCRIAQSFPQPWSRYGFRDVGPMCIAHLANVSMRVVHRFNNQYGTLGERRF